MNLIDLEILSKFKEISKRLLDLQKDVLSNTKIGIAEFKMLSILDMNEKFSQTNLGNCCNLDKPTISKLINKMYNENLVNREEDKQDRRITYIKLSTKGKEILYKLREKVFENYNKYFNFVSDNDKKTFIELLNRILNKEEIC